MFFLIEHKSTSPHHSGQVNGSRSSLCMSSSQCLVLKPEGQSVDATHASETLVQAQNLMLHRPFIGNGHSTNEGKENEGFQRPFRGSSGPHLTTFCWILGGQSQESMHWDMAALRSCKECCPGALADWLQDEQSPVTDWVLSRSREAHKSSAVGFT